MPYSGTVATSDWATPAQYNNLRLDALGDRGLYASEIVRNTNATARVSTSIFYTKLKEVKLGTVSDLYTMRIKFDLGGGFEENLVYGRIYRNTVAIGIEQSALSTQTFSEDFTASAWAINDLIQIYGKSPDGVLGVSISNMKFYYSKYITALSDDTLTTALSFTTDPTITMTNQDP